MNTTKPMQVRISVAIITYNEERNIRRCLQSVQGIADDIVVIDSHSTDATRSICMEYGARVIEQQFLGYVAQKNLANDAALYDHVLSLDADEELSPELKRSVTHAKDHWQHDGYELKRLTNYCGHWVRYCGWYPDKKIRLFDRRKARWTGEALHERLELDDTSAMGTLKGDLLHYSYYTINDHLKQIDKFTDIQARELFEKGKRPNLFQVRIKPQFKFLRDYIFKLGFLDGFYGYTIARLSSQAVLIKYVKAELLFRNK